MNWVKTYATQIQFQLGTSWQLAELERMIEVPKYETQGDLAFPCFTLAKSMKRPPASIASELAGKLQPFLFQNIVAQGPYVNVFLDKKQVSRQVIDLVLSKKEQYGSNDFGEGQTITLDLSSPNIAKPFSMGHLRSTVIGNAIANLAEKNGFNTVRINHLGDWGTQFGKLITAYRLWGSEAQVKKAPIQELLSLYVRFHKEAESSLELNDEARRWFKELESGNEEARALWKWFRDESLLEFNKIYQLLGVSFDSTNGEAFYNDKMSEVVELLEEKQLLTRSDGADVVLLDEYGLPPLLIRKSDGATLYGTRDLAAALYRKRNYGFDSALYVVGQEQSLHFRQVFLVLQKMGYNWAQEMKHVSFGFILKDGKKMSTRKGKVVLLEQVIREAIQMAEQNITDKNPDLLNKQQVAEQVGVGAILFHDLKNDRQNHVEFSLDSMLKVEGTTGPYVQYTHARACSILRKARSRPTIEITGLDDPHSWTVVKKLMAFPEVIEKSGMHNEPSHLAKYLLELAQAFNSFYSHVKVLENDESQSDRLALVQATAIVLKEGLRILGIKAPEQM